MVERCLITESQCLSLPICEKASNIIKVVSNWSNKKTDTLLKPTGRLLEVMTESLYEIQNSLNSAYYPGSIHYVNSKTDETDVMMLIDEIIKELPSNIKYVLFLENYHKINYKQWVFLREDDGIITVAMILIGFVIQ